MPQIRVGIQLASLRMPFRKALLTAARLGADGVEIDARSQVRPAEVTRTGLRQLRKMLDDFNLRACAVAFPTRRGYQVPDDLDRRIEATKEAMRFAYDIGAGVLINDIGYIAPRPDEDGGIATERDILVESLTELGRFGQRVGTVLAAETGSSDGAALAGLIAELPAGTLAVNFDPGNLIVHGFSASEAIGSLAPYVAHVHARDGVRDLAKGRGLETPLGRGSVDFAELIGTLEEHTYRGFFTVERENAQDPVTEIGQAVEYLRSL